MQIMKTCKQCGATYYIDSNDNIELCHECYIQNTALQQLKEKLHWLSTHNKNYTKQQYHTILDCLELTKELIKKEKELEKFIELMRK